MKLTGIFLISLFCCQFSYGNRPLWQRKRNQAMQYFYPNSQLSYSQGKQLFNRAAEVGLRPFQFVSWQGPTVSDPAYILTECLFLTTPEELNPCLRFNWNLNYASPLYLAWIFAHGYSVEILKLNSEKILNNQTLSAIEKEQFDQLFYNTREVQIIGHIQAMRFWHELVDHWDQLQLEMRNLGTPHDHDYAEDYGSYSEFSEIARINQLSLNLFWSYWNLGQTQFISYLNRRGPEVHSVWVSLEEWADPKLEDVKQYLKKEFQQIVGN